MEYLPNALSLSRVPLSVALVWCAWDERWGFAAAVMMVALLTDALDGAIARRYGVESKFGGDTLEPLCDLLLACAAVGGLVLGDVWSIWVAVGLAVVTGLLQLSHSTPLRRHAYYLHPLFFVALVFVVGGVYLWLAFESTWIEAVYIGLLVFVSAAKHKRWLHWLAGPPALV